MFAARFIWLLLGLRPSVFDGPSYLRELSSQLSKALSQSA